MDTVHKKRDKERRKGHILENNRRRKHRNRIWLALSLLGVIIGANILFRDSPPVQSAQAFLNKISNQALPPKSNEDSQKQQNTAQEPDSPVPTKPEPASPVAKPAEVPDVPAVGKMIAHIHLSKPTVYLTFDDGPGRYTQDIVEILDKNNIKGGFFWVGQNLKTEQQSIFAKKMLENGHIIGTHTMHHEKLKKKPKDVQVQMIRASTDHISKKIGAPIYYFRPPYGAIDQNTLVASKETNQILAYWNVDSLDWKYGDKPDLIMNNIAKEVKPGSIILMHEKEQTVKLLPKVIELLKQKGYDIAPLPVPDSGKKS